MVYSGRIMYSDIDLESTPLWSRQRFSSRLGPLTCTPGGPGTPCSPGTPGNPCKNRGRGEGAVGNCSFLLLSRERCFFFLPLREERVGFTEPVTAQDSVSPGGSIQNKRSPEYKRSSQMHNLAGPHHFKGP